MKIKLSILCLLVIGLTSSIAQTKKKPVAAKAVPAASNATEGIFAEIDTDKGKILLQLEYKKTPVTVANFVALVEGTNASVTDANLKGKPFFNGLKFHRVIADFMIQGGDPAGNGSGGPGYAFKDEFVSDLKHNRPGVLSMANSGPKTNGSQFFITHKETPWLDNKHTVFGFVIKGQEVVNAIKQDDLIKSITITRKGAEAKKFDAPKIFADYMANKATDEAKEAAIAAENKRKQAEAEAQRQAEHQAKYGPVFAAKAKYLSETKATATETTSGLKYKIIQTGTGKKPADGTNVFIHYAGYLEDGTLFDSSYEAVNKECGKFDENRAKQNGYQPFPFQYGKKDGLIAGFIEGLSFMNFGDKAILFIPAKLGYGERGAGNVIPPNSNIIFEVEMLETAPATKQ
ncbi:peptidylprolyl isomerase [Flavobacterium sp. J49]|uniref:peptidylprolyl isomerase n=1 Tax=Flavobacterium sp. J49 TaxID=2718534 RepID=UPI001592BA01|nr:peptidylprolyl isomerase [Flavobacterium sp. J49]MBF6639889.1 peptidylprolyl isomerase [Flavobacterium sp. J49]NIC01134.1 peptidylprolyl isomerase [Flavobacterium sp. J49]